MKRDIGLDVLLELNGTEYTEENGYWYKIKASRTESTPERPHGIRYNLTLHDNYNKRIMGFDNAHRIKLSKKLKGKYKGQIITYDHLHSTAIDKGTPYTFKSAEQLLNDFFDRVNKILEETMRS